MAIEKRTGLFYELLLRGIFGGAHQKAGELGQFSGGHLIEAEAVVDTGTGEVISYNLGNAVPISEERAKAYFGENFAAFNAGFDALRAENAKQTADLQAANFEIGRLKAELEKKQAALEAQAAIAAAADERARLAEAALAEAAPAAPVA